MSLEIRAIVLYTILIVSLSITSLFAIQNYQASADYDRKTNLFSGNPGGHAWDYLQNSTYTELLFEVDVLSPYLNEGLGSKKFDTDFLAGHFDLAEQLIESECMNKTIRYVWSSSQIHYFRTIDSPYFPEYTASELRTLAGSYRDYSTEGHTSVMHVIFLDGKYVPSGSSGPAIGGTAYAGTTVDATTVFIFLPETVDNFNYGGEYPYLSRDIAHEVGHLLGLVAPFGSDSSYNPPGAVDHRDPESVRHCSNVSCLMSTDINKGNELCDECKADLAYMRSETAPYAGMAAPNIDWFPVVAGIILGTMAVAGILFTRRY